MDEEGNTDVIARLLALMFNEGHIDRAIEERNNMVRSLDRCEVCEVDLLVLGLARRSRHL